MTEYQYDDASRLLSVTEPNGDTVSYTYDDYGNRATMTYPNGKTVTYTYDACGRLIASTDARGSTTSYEYDAADHLVKTVYPNGGEEISRYNAKGQLESATNPEGETTHYEYDAAGRTVRKIWPDGGVSENTYDVCGRVISESDANGNTITYTYDLAGRIVEATDPMGNKTGFAYDAVGNLLSITDALGNVTAYEYDALNRAISMTDANGATMTYAYDCVGNLVSETDALGNVTTYDYDLNGSITENAEKPTAADAAAHPGEMAYHVDNVKVARLSVMSNYNYALVLAGSGKLSSLWNAVKTTVKEAASNFVDNFRQAPVKTVASTLVSAVKTVVNPVGAIIDAVSTVSNEMKAQNPQPASSAPSNSSGGSSGSFDYSTSIYGSYTASSSGGFIDESGWYYSPPTPESPTIELADWETAQQCANGAAAVVNDFVRLFKAEFSQYSPALISMGSVALAEPTPGGEIVTGVTAIGIALVVAGGVAGDMLYKAYKNGTFIDLDNYQLPDIVVDLLPQIHNPPILSLPLPDLNVGTTESLPLPDEDKGGNISTDPLPEQGGWDDYVYTAEDGTKIDTTPSDNHTVTTKNPGTKGEPNSSVDILDSDGNLKTRRWFDSEGKASRDVDFTNHGNPAQHPDVPHEHFWDWDENVSTRK